MAKQPITHKSAQRIAELVLRVQCETDDRQLLIDHIGASLARHQLNLFEVVRAGLYALGGLKATDREAANVPCDWLTTSNWYKFVEDVRELDLSWFDQTLLNLFAHRPSLSLSELEELDAIVKTHLSRNDEDAENFDDTDDELQAPRQPTGGPTTLEDKQMAFPI